jgi:hypothetical protein
VSPDPPPAKKPATPTEPGYAQIIWDATTAYRRRHPDVDAKLLVAVLNSTILRIKDEEESE